MEREVVFPERMEVCQNHPDKAEIFWLEQMMIKAGYPYYFNFWEDLRPVFGGEEDGDPESIDWDTYKFLIEVGRPAGNSMAEISVCFSRQGDPKLLELLHIGLAEGEEPVEKLHFELSAEAAMEIIENYFKTA